MAKRLHDMRTSDICRGRKVKTGSAEHEGSLATLLFNPHDGRGRMGGSPVVNDSTVVSR